MSRPAARRWLEGPLEGGGTRAAESLGLPARADDAAIARELVARVAATPPTAVEPAAIDRASREDGATAAASVLGRAKDLSDVRALELVVRGGPLRARREALARIATLLDEERLEPESVAQLDTLFSTLRDLDLTAALSRARRKLPGAAGREAKADDDAVHVVAERVLVAVRGFWEGEESEEPIGALDPEERALVMTRLGRTPDLLAAHVAAILDGSAPATDAARLEVLGQLRHAADPRLVPALGALLGSRRSELVLGAAQALSRTDDPRVGPMLVDALRRAAAPHERAVLAGALGRIGDTRGADWARRLLSASDAGSRRAALDAMTVLATPADVEALSLLAGETDPRALRLLALALGRTGDVRALGTLARLRSRGIGALEVDVEEAESMLRALVELRGEAPPAAEGAPVAPTDAATTPGRAVLRTSARPSLAARALGGLDWMLGGLWAWTGARARAMARFERAAARVPGWAAPLVALAESLFSSGDTARALGAIRRAIDADRSWVEAHARATALVSRVFLRRAEETARGGLRDVARGLLEEVLALDLRRAPSPLRFELERRLTTLGAEASP